MFLGRIMVWEKSLVGAKGFRKQRKAALMVPRHIESLCFVLRIQLVHWMLPPPLILARNSSTTNLDP